MIQKCDRISARIALALLLVLVNACGQRDAPVDATNQPARMTLPLTADTVLAPVAEQRPYEVAAPHGATRQDEYYWLRDDQRSNRDMLAYLAAENAYADAVMTPLEGFEAVLYEELVGRIKQDDSSVP